MGRRATRIAAIAAAAAIPTGVAAQVSIEATWSGGAGDYADPTAWSYDPAPGQATIPSNVDDEFFRVRLGDPATPPADVSLGVDVTIDALHLDAGDVLTLENGVTLDMANPGTREGAGTIVNEGLLTLAGSDAPTTIHYEGDLMLSGGGTLRLSDSPENRIEDGPGGGLESLINDTGHTIEGAGTIDALPLNNLGTILATGDHPLVITSLLRQLGTLEARGAGGLVIEGSISAFDIANEGVMRVVDGSSLSSPRALVNVGTLEVTTGGLADFSAAPFRGVTNESDGRIRVSGAGSELRGRLVNNGALEVSDGGLVTTSQLLQRGATATGWIGAGSELVVTGAPFGSVIEGDFAVDGILRSESNDITLSEGVLRGTGRLELGDRQLTVAAMGILAPGGLSQAGRFDITGDVKIERNPFAPGFLDGLLQLEIGGEGEGEFDILLVDGSIDIEGMLEVVLIDPSGGSDPFDPGFGDVFDLITADVIVDLGERVSLPSLDGDLRFVSSVVGAGSMEVFRLTVVPEPSTAALAALGLTWLGARGRQRRTRSAAP